MLLKNFSGKIQFSAPKPATSPICKSLAATDQKMKSDFELPSNFAKQINAVFPLLGGVGKTMEDKELLDYLLKNEIDYISAKEIIIFLPIAFARCLLTNINWPETYLENSLKPTPVLKVYNETESYLRILQETKEYLKNEPDSEVFLNIAGRSSEFRIINQVLLDNPETEIDDIQISETIINRHFDGSC